MAITIYTNEDIKPGAIAGQRIVDAFCIFIRLVKPFLTE